MDAASRRRRTVWLVYTGALVALLVLLTLHVVRVGADPLDRELTLRLTAPGPPGGAGPARLISSLGASWFIYPAALVVSIVLARTGRVSTALLFAFTVVGAGVSQSLLKGAVGRPRPDLIRPLVRVATDSFPSGHAAMAVAFFGGLAALVFLRTRSGVARASAVAGAVLAAGAVGVTRVFLGVHWATDVAGGILLGLFWVAVLAGATPAAERRR